MGLQQFGVRLKHMRELHGFTRYDICMALDVNIPDLKAVEDGEYLPSSSKIEYLACMIGVGVTDLVNCTDAEAHYYALRAKREFNAVLSDEDRYIRRRLLYGLLRTHYALLSLYRALWFHKFYSPQPRFESLRAEIAERCKLFREALKSHGYEMISDHVKFPDLIIESEEENALAGRRNGDIALREWIPMLVQGQQWIVQMLSQIGGSITPDELDNDPIFESMQAFLANATSEIKRLDSSVAHICIERLWWSDVDKLTDLCNQLSFVSRENAQEDSLDQNAMPGDKTRKT